jgi:hypothetical protein
MIDVVNFKDFGSTDALSRSYGDRWIYVGRQMARYGLVHSPLGNPFKRGECASPIEDYRRWLYSKIGHEPNLVDGIFKLNPETQEVLRIVLTEDPVLVCWCKPAPCHADVIINAAGWLRCVFLTQLLSVNAYN